MKNPNITAIDPLIRQQQLQQPLTNIDEVIKDQRLREMHFAAQYEGRMLPGAESHYDVVTGVTKDSKTGEIVKTTDYIMPKDPNVQAAKNSEAAWNSQPMQQDSEAFKAFAAALKMPESDKQSQPAQVALADVVVLEPVRLPEEQVTVEHTPTEIAS